MSRALFVALLVLIAAPAIAQPLAGFEAWVSKAIKDWRMPGLAVAVVKDGRMVFAQGFGVRELGKPAQALSAGSGARAGGPGGGGGRHGPAYRREPARNVDKL